MTPLSIDQLQIASQKLLAVDFNVMDSFIQPFLQEILPYLLGKLI